MNREKLEAAGIDYKTGLAHFAGREMLYQKYLLKFKEDGHVREAISALSKGAYEEVLEQIHALKGLSGTLGFTKLFQKTSLVVTRLREGNREELGEKLQEIEDEQRILLEVIEKELL